MSNQFIEIKFPKTGEIITISTSKILTVRISGTDKTEILIEHKPKEEVIIIDETYDSFVTRLGTVRVE